MLFNIITLTEQQYGWMVVALTILLSYVQNLLESHNGRRLIGARS